MDKETINKMKCTDDNNSNVLFYPCNSEINTDKSVIHKLVETERQAFNLNTANQKLCEFGDKNKKTNNIYEVGKKIQNALIHPIKNPKIINMIQYIYEAKLYELHINALKNKQNQLKKQQQNKKNSDTNNNNNNNKSSNNSNIDIKRHKNNIHYFGKRRLSTKLLDEIRAHPLTNDGTKDNKIIDPNHQKSKRVKYPVIKFASNSKLNHDERNILLLNDMLDMSVKQTDNDGSKCKKNWRDYMHLSSPSMIEIPKTEEEMTIYLNESNGDYVPINYNKNIVKYNTHNNINNIVNKPRNNNNNTNIRNNNSNRIRVNDDFLDPNIRMHNSNQTNPNNMTNSREFFNMNHRMQTPFHNQRNNYYSNIRHNTNNNNYNHTRQYPNHNHRSLMYKNHHRLNNPNNHYNINNYSHLTKDQMRRLMMQNNSYNHYSNSEMRPSNHNYTKQQQQLYQQLRYRQQQIYRQLSSKGRSNNPYNYRQQLHHNTTNTNTNSTNNYARTNPYQRATFYHNNRHQQRTLPTLPCSSNIKSNYPPQFNV